MKAGKTNSEANIPCHIDRPGGCPPGRNTCYSRETKDFAVSAGKTVGSTGCYLISALIDN